MLRLGRLTDYATVAMAEIALDPQRLYAAADLAAMIGLSVPTTSKILKLLARARLLRSIRGAAGGYVLSRPPTEISVAEMIDALEGPVALTVCSIDGGRCPRETRCRIRDNWRGLNGAIHDALDRVTLADLMRPAAIAAPARPADRGPRGGRHAEP